MATPQQQPKKKGFPWLTILIAIVVVYFIWSTVNSGEKLEKATYDKFIKDIGLVSTPTTSASGLYEFDTEANKIGYVYFQGQNCFVLYKGDASTYEKRKNDFVASPKKNASYSLYAMDYYKIRDIVQAQNENIQALYYEQENDPGHVHDGTVCPGPILLSQQVLLNDNPATTSWFSFDNILTILMIVVTLIIVFVLFRTFTGKAGGLGNMGRNRATVVLSSPTRFTDVAGIDEEKEEVQEIVQFLKNPKKFLDLGARIPKGFLLVGGPGTGKTLLAKAIAGEAGVPFFSISGSDFSEMLVGVGPSRMRDLFEQAKVNAPAIIFIDEIDSIARMRGVGVSGVSDENEQTLNQLLVQMDGFTKSEGVVVLAATNRPDVLDQALLRPGRFDRQIIVQMPDVKGREKILAVHSKNKPLAADVDLKRVAKITSGFSGADIENLMNESAIIAAKKDKTKINMLDITEGINKVLLGPQKKSRIITADDKKITAYHEAGHAIVSRVLQKDQVVQEVSIIPRGMAAGYTLTNEKDVENHHKSKTFLSNQLVVLMAGRTAEETFIGDICTGSQNDLKVATELAEAMVTKFGMSDKLGPVYYGKEDEIALRMYNNKNHSESLQSVIDSEVKVLLAAAEKQCREILKTNSAKVKVMADVLLERETIYADDIALIMEGKDVPRVILEMEKREEAAKEQLIKDKIEHELEKLEAQMQPIFDQAQKLFGEKLITEQKLEKLKSNMEVARKIVGRGEKLKVLPTLDNIENYAKLVEFIHKDEKAKPNVKKDSPESSKPKPEPTPTAEVVVKKQIKKKKDEEQ